MGSYTLLRRTQYRIDSSPSVCANREILEVNAGFTQLLATDIGVICGPGTMSAQMVSAFYDIFKRNDLGVGVWVDKATNLDAARARIIDLARVAPDQYLVVHSRTGRIITAGTMVTSRQAWASRSDSGETLIG